MSGAYPPRTDATTLAGGCLTMFSLGDSDSLPELDSVEKMKLLLLLLYVGDYLVRQIKH